MSAFDFLLTWLAVGWLLCGDPTEGHTGTAFLALAVAAFLIDAMRVVARKTR
jgi:hypothetical protein